MNTTSLFTTNNIRSKYVRYVIMFRDNVIGEFSSDNYDITEVLEIKSIEDCPRPLTLSVLSDTSIYKWLTSRACDTTRSNMRVMFKKFKLNAMNNLEIALSNYALTMTDEFWVKPYDVQIDYSDVCLYDRAPDINIAELSLSGAANFLEYKINHEQTSIGSFNKCWKREHNEWLLYKGGSVYNKFAELFTYKLGIALGLNMAKIVVRELYDTKYVCSINFTNHKQYLEHWDSIASKIRLSSDAGYDEIVDVLEKFNLDSANDFKLMYILDGVVCNPDRHSFNWGFLIPLEPDKSSKIAPNFDNNLALNSCIDSFKQLSTTQLKFVKCDVASSDDVWDRFRPIDMVMIEAILEECCNEYIRLNDTELNHIRHYFECVVAYLDREVFRLRDSH